MEKSIVKFNGRKIEVSPEFSAITLDIDGKWHIIKGKPIFVKSKGAWKGVGIQEFGESTFDADYLATEWHLEDAKAIKQFLIGFCSRCILELVPGEVLDLDFQIKERWKIFKTWQSNKDLFESQNLLEAHNMSFQEGDDVEIPTKYTHIAVDANGDICVFKNEPTLKTTGEYATWSGSGRKQIGVAVWNFSKLEGKPKDFEKAKKVIAEDLEDFRFKIEDVLDFGDTLNQTGKFKIVFAKYNEIDKLNESDDSQLSKWHYVLELGRKEYTKVPVDYRYLLVADRLYAYPDRPVFSEESEWFEGGRDFQDLGYIGDVGIRDAYKEGIDIDFLETLVILDLQDLTEGGTKVAEKLYRTLDGIKEQIKTLKNR